MHNPIMSVHFPKAAGTSFRLQLAQVFGDALELDYFSPPLAHLPEVSRDQLSDGKRVVHGHFPARRYANVQKAFRITFLREPIDNLISIYFYWKKLPEHGIPIHTRFLAEKPGICEFALYPEICNLMSEQYFGGFDPQLLDFVGFFHRNSTDIETLSRLLNVPLKADLFENKTEYSGREREEILADSAKMGKLRSALKQDIEFYDKIMQRFC